MASWFAIIFVISVLVDFSDICSAHIIGGTPATFKHTKYQVSIRLKEPDAKIFGDGHLCGGVLIDLRTVLSAAHCFENPNRPDNYYIVMGTLNRFEKTGNTLLLEIDEIRIHPNFTVSTFRNDLAIINLKYNVPEGNPVIAVIPLNNFNLPPNTRCQVSGWGVTEKGKLSDVLLTADVSIIDRKLCTSNYGTELVHDGMICAGYMTGKKDSCDGDSGGPLICKGRLVGIVSSGSEDGCARKGFPGLYTDVRYNIKWIEDNKALRNLGIRLSKEWVYAMILYAFTGNPIWFLIEFTFHNTTTVLLQLIKTRVVTITEVDAIYE